MALSLTVTLALAGCGSSPEETAGEFVAALAEMDAERACSLLTGPAKRELASEGFLLGAGTCEEVVEQSAANFDDREREALQDVEFEEVSVDGNHAVIDDKDVFSSAGPLPEDFADGGSTELENIDGEWLISGFEDEAVGSSESGDLDEDGVPYYCEPGYAGSIPCERGGERSANGYGETPVGNPLGDGTVVKCGFHGACLQRGRYVEPPVAGQECASGIWQELTRESRWAYEYQCFEADL